MPPESATADLQVLQTVCPLDCPDACQLEVQVSGGEVVRIDGSRLHPLTAGFICGKVRNFNDYLHCPERLRTPARRVGPKGEAAFEPISWDEALDEVAQRLQDVSRQFGGESILPFCYGGSNGYLTQDTADARLFRRLRASRLARTVCAAAVGRAFEGLYGRMPGVFYDDFVHARLIVLWGVNPTASGIHLVPYIRDARKHGAKLVVVDPRRTPLAAGADLHLPVHPGTDLPVALSIIHWLFENNRADLAFLNEHATGTDELRKRASRWTIAEAARVARLAPDDLEAFARLYADTSPAVIRCGWGLERNRNGGSATAAVLALPAVAGKFGLPGGGFTMSNGSAWKLSSESAINEPPVDTRVINMNRLGHTLLHADDPPVKALFVYNANPLATVPEQTKVRDGLLRDDLFTVVFDQVLTDTARYADIVLPATTFLEHTEYRRGYGSGYLVRGTRVLSPIGQARPNYEVFAELCERLGLARDDDPRGPEELIERILNSAADRERLHQELDATGVATPSCGPHPVQFVDVFPGTADRKIHLVAEALDREAPLGLYGFADDARSGEYPLALISPASSETISSTFAQLRPNLGRVEIHPEDAGPRGIADGDPVRIFNATAEVLCPCRVTATIKPGVLVLPKGLWTMHTGNGLTSNALAPDTLTDLGGGACFNDARVQVERARGDTEK